MMTDDDPNSTPAWRQILQISGRVTPHGEAASQVNNIAGREALAPLENDANMVA